MINKSFVLSVDLNAAQQFCKKNDFELIIEDHIIFLKKKNVSIQFWNDMSVSFFELKYNSESYSIFYLLYHKNGNTAISVLHKYNILNNDSLRLKYMLEIMEEYFEDFIQIKENELAKYFFYSDFDYMEFIKKVKSSY